MPSVDLSGARVSTASRAPLSSLHLTLRYLGGDRSEPRFARRMQDGLTPEMRRVLSSMLGPRDGTGIRRGSFPSVMTPVLDDLSAWKDQAADAIADTSADDLLYGVAFMTGGRSTVQWRALEERPREWLHAAGAAMRVANAAFDELWNATTARRELELHLLDQLLVAGVAPQAITDLMPPLQVDSHRIVVGKDDGLTVAVQPHVELVPMITSPGGYMLSSGANRIQVGYAIRGALAPTDSRRVANDPLRVLIGEVRAAMLRVLDRPRVMSELAYMVGRAPSTLSVHARLMIDARLAERVELGNRAWLVRTRRGDQLLRMFDDDSIL